ncbi:hypothetical protein JG687_00005594 [Phytophthora cactorum]|uniref:DUF501 domain-containing protein n=1 Tax=Phytophthora cactorum TaxID=29920 RepID=A0A329RZZ6_9STRA|nr:Protein of unknown function DUF501 [Phytophthora cactorum]KAG3110135.1 hypothetical protein PI125_g10293 [Phytophthora idaei]KAG2765619.1 hypothetical protein Pcac1_g22829 [Phytophthora cactorum]KAG2820347.1 hypothetical protein PC112_g11815 [Phytophthora cactorum]KAG2821701.1 hypothetical protein PC111_g10925 [Phytophthora cactorum]
MTSETNDIVHEGLPCEASEVDVALVQEELGYVPNNLVKVSAFVDSNGRTSRSRESEDHRPAVLLLYPLRNAEDAYKKKQRAKVEPFPTIYWLASTELKARVSTLEDQQYVLSLQHRLDTDEAAKEKMAQSHREYAEQRWKMMTPHDLEIVKGRHWEFVLRDVGIAGIREYTNVKCLHTHYAHYLSTGNNQIGEWVQELLDSTAT